MEGERLKADKAKQVLYRTVPDFIRLISKVQSVAICPGHLRKGKLTRPQRGGVNRAWQSCKGLWSHRLGLEIAQFSVDVEQVLLIKGLI